jgi:4-hydroxy-tetrahydrodipicolinate synthase
MLEGIIPVLLTPLLSNHKPDYDGLFNLYNYLFENHVGGFWALGSAGEDVNLPFKTKISFGKKLIEINDKKLPIILGNGLTATEDIINFYNSFSENSISGAQILPYDNKMGDSRLIHFVNYISERIPFPIWLYHNPKRGRLYSLDVLKELKNNPKVIGIKVGGYSLSFFQSVLKEQNENFQVIGAGSGQMFSFMTLGSKAHTSSEASVYPHLFYKLYQYITNKDYSEALNLQNLIIDISKKIPRNSNGEYAAEEKYILFKKGICQEYVNPIYELVTSKNKNIIDLIIDKYDL